MNKKNEFSSANKEKENIEDKKDLNDSLDTEQPESLQNNQNNELNDTATETETETDKETEKAETKNLEDKIKELRDEKLRLLADMENLRKRLDRDKIESIKYGSVNLARDILSPGDNLTRALEAIPDAEKESDTIKNLIHGLLMVQKEFSSILERHGVKKIDALNKKFDHNFHQAMLEIENDKTEEGLVVKEIQSGYTMHERLLRPSMVGVSKKPNKTSKDEKK